MLFRSSSKRFTGANSSSISTTTTTSATNGRLEKTSMSGTGLSAVGAPPPPRPWSRETISQAAGAVPPPPSLGLARVQSRDPPRDLHIPNPTLPTLPVRHHLAAATTTSAAGHVVSSSASAAASSAASTPSTTATITSTLHASGGSGKTPTSMEPSLVSGAINISSGGGGSSPHHQQPLPAASVPFPAAVARSLRNINPSRDNLRKIGDSLGQSLVDFKSSCQTTLPFNPPFQ